MTRNVATASLGTKPPAAPVATASERLTIEHRCDLELDALDTRTLDALIDSRPHAGVFLSRAWLAGLFADPPDGFEPSLLLFREGGALRGVVPLATRVTPTHVRVGLLGGCAGSDRVDVLAARGAEAACADAFLRWLSQSFGAKGFALELRDVPDDSPLWGAVHRCGNGACVTRAATRRRRGLALQPRDVRPLPYLSLAEPGSRHEIGAGCGNKPTSLDKHRRWLERRGSLRIELLEDPVEIAAAFESLVQFLRARWHGRGDGSALDDPRAQRFHRGALPLLRREGRLRMIRLASDMRTIAVFYGLAAGSWWGYYLAGYDREWAGRIHLGRITLAAAIELASREGAAEFDFLKGAEPVKYLWPVRERLTVDADVYSGGAGAQLARAGRAARDAAAALVRSSRELL